MSSTAKQTKKHSDLASVRCGNTTECDCWRMDWRRGTGTGTVEKGMHRLQPMHAAPKIDTVWKSNPVTPLPGNLQVRTTHTVSTPHTFYRHNRRHSGMSQRKPGTCLDPRTQAHHKHTCRHTNTYCWRNVVCRLWLIFIGWLARL